VFNHSLFPTRTARRRTKPARAATLLASLNQWVATGRYSRKRRRCWRSALLATQAGPETSTPICVSPCHIGDNKDDARLYFAAILLPDTELGHTCSFRRSNKGDPGIFALADGTQSRGRQRYQRQQTLRAARIYGKLLMPACCRCGALECGRLPPGWPGCRRASVPRYRRLLPAHCDCSGRACHPSILHRPEREDNTRLRPPPAATMSSHPHSGVWIRYSRGNHAYLSPYTSPIPSPHPPPPISPIPVPTGPDTAKRMVGTQNSVRGRGRGPPAPAGGCWRVGGGGGTQPKLGGGVVVSRHILRGTHGIKGRASTAIFFYNKFPRHRELRSRRERMDLIGPVQRTLWYRAQRDVRSPSAASRSGASGT